MKDNKEEGRVRGEAEVGALIGVEAEVEDSKAVWEVHAREWLLRAVEGNHMQTCFERYRCCDGSLRLWLRLAD